MSNEPAKQLPRYYFSYATIGDVFCGGTFLFLCWLVVNIIGVILYFTVDNTFDGITNIFPKWLWIGIISSAILWFFRGKELKVPNVSFREWLFYSIGTLLYIFIIEIVPHFWVYPIASTTAFLAMFVEMVNHVGKMNFMKLNADVEVE